ncbi:MAG: type II toxin-antitoxin system Phd/YefM family antitoxin [Vicinamibacteria bacterium]|nr:type II toxin-antitoxin system Phd/YefM family antitoxin [Vicinamibacteria bacterium]
MSHRYSIAEARSQLPTIVDQAEAGREIELTRRGRPVAVVVSCQAFEHLRGRRRSFGDAYRGFLERHSLDAIGLDDNLAASTRDKSSGRPVAL